MPLIWFLDSTYYKGIYAWWVTELRHLNITIKYIIGTKNSTANGLSWTIFPNNKAVQLIPELD